MLDIRLLGDPILRRPSDEIGEIDEGIRELAAEMFETMYASEGIGLAAPQVGVPVRLFVMDTQQDAADRRAVVNPRIVERGGTDRAEEGCLSIPGLSALVDRAETIVMEGLDLEGNRIRVEASGLEARCIQHEIDHLDGVLFLDRISPMNREMLLKKWRKLQNEAARP